MTKAIFFFLVALLYSEADAKQTKSVESQPTASITCG